MQIYHKKYSVDLGRKLFFSCPESSQTCYLFLLHNKRSGVRLLEIVKPKTVRFSRGDAGERRPPPFLPSDNIPTRQSLQAFAHHLTLPFNLPLFAYSLRSSINSQSLSRAKQYWPYPNYY